MSTPEKPRPSLDDTLHHIDQVLDEPVPKPPCLRCARQALLGSPFCAAHQRLPCVVSPLDEADQIRASLREQIGNRPYLKPALEYVVTPDEPMPRWYRILRRLFT